MIMSINHPNRVVVLATTIALVLLVVATVNTVGATAADVGSGVRQYNTQKYYRGGSVRGVRATKRRNLSERSEKSSKSLKLTKSQVSDTDVVAPTGRDGNATTADDDYLSADEFEDENNSTTIINDTNSTQEEDADELDFEDDDVPIDDSNSTSTTTTISNITTPVFVRTPISNELNPAAVGAADGGGNGTNDASCSAAPLCTRNGLTGDCCPTSEGVSLACCARNFGSLPEPAPAAAVEGED